MADGECGITRDARSVSRVSKESSLSLGLAVAVALLGCGDPSTNTPDSGLPGTDGRAAERHDGEEQVGHAGEEETIAISLEIQQRFGIVVERAGPGPVEVTLDLPGEIRADPDRIVHVKPPFAGVVTEVEKHVGDVVRAGEVLVVLESSQTLSKYSIKAAIDGTITEEHAPVGEYVDPDHPLFTIVDTSVVWVELQVPASDLERVHKEAPVEVLIRGAEPGTLGTIFFVNPVVDEVTRTAAARVVLSNTGALRPGLFVTGRVAVERKQAQVSVPSSALVRDGDGWVVFVREGDTRFSRYPIEVSLRGLDRSAIESGIETGAQVVSVGAFLVKSEAAQGEMGGGHSH